MLGILQDQVSEEAQTLLWMRPGTLHKAEGVTTEDAADFKEQHMAKSNVYALLAAQKGKGRNGRQHSAPKNSLEANHTPGTAPIPVPVPAVFSGGGGRRSIARNTSLRTACCSEATPPLIPEMVRGLSGLAKARGCDDICFFPTQRKTRGQVRTKTRLRCRTSRGSTRS